MIHTSGIPLVLKTSKNAKHVTTALKIWISVKKSDAKDNAEAALGLVQVAVDDSDIKRPGLETADHASAVLNSIASLSKSLGTVVGVIVDKMGDLAEVCSISLLPCTDTLMVSVILYSFILMLILHGKLVRPYMM